MTDKSQGDAKGDPKGVAIQETPEFKAAVAAAVATALPDAVKLAVSQVQAELINAASKGDKEPKVAAAEGAGGDFVERLALAIAEISDQGTNRKRVAPEILAQRAAKQREMVERLQLARERGEKPEYRLVSKVYLNERLIEPYMPGPNKQAVPTEIIWLGVPSEAMRPINKPAEEIYQLFRESVGSTEAIKGQDNRPFYLTVGGVVIKGDARAQRREVAADNRFNDGLQVASDPRDPTAPFVHVLGTVAAPARQNVPPGGGSNAHGHHSAVA
ncbi:hypothetical protein SAMN05216337_1017131 [Bradyrhizobium brasilense]|uniref:Uncharacterized protein n=1 Tax=Bradyrhizobium brasilense TaxID=1419277 RepID=A0A1G6YZ97_9BRAD|nr:hypothetical protein [Bradyrhizobium brasilense]SDD94957.1 hypothetical protein SAMN05216337_1017131 [Bradyrhizobium brasilense]